MPEPVAHKLIEAGSSVLSSKSFSIAAGSVASVQAGSESLVGGLSLSLLQSRAHPWSPELWSRHAFKESGGCTPSQFG